MNERSHQQKPVRLNRTPFSEQWEAVRVNDSGVITWRAPIDERDTGALDRALMGDPRIARIEALLQRSKAPEGYYLIDGDQVAVILAGGDA